MDMRSLRAARILVAVAAAGMVSFAAVGCTASSPTASSTTTTMPPAAPSTVHTAPAVTVQQLQFPNASAMVKFTGYDTKDKMVEFQKVVQNPAAQAADLIPDPKDPAVHRLALAPNTNVTSIDPNGFPFETCPPVHCTSDDIIQTVMARMTLWAKIHVNAADQINVVTQMSY